MGQLAKVSVGGMDMTKTTKKKHTNWIAIGLTVVVVYVVGFFYGVGSTRFIAFFSGDTPLNNIGDFLAGVFAFPAFTLLAAAVLTQRQELNLTKVELAKSADAMDKQVDLLTDQSRIQKAVARSNYRVTLFQERFTLYRYFSVLSESIGDEVSTVKMIEATNNIEKVKYVFGPDVYEQGAEYFEIVQAIKLDVFQYESHFTHIPPLYAEEIVFSNGPDNIEEMLFSSLGRQNGHLSKLCERGRFVDAMRKALQLDADIDFVQG